MPSMLALSFVILVVLLYAILIIGVTFAENRSGRPSRIPLYVLRILGGGFILVTGLAALSGFFRDFESLPPRVFFGIAPGFVAMLVLAFMPYTRKWLAVWPVCWLVGAQVFRLIVEIQLHFLAKTSLFPTMMTFAGVNFDIVTGVSAPFVAFYLKRLIERRDFAMAMRLGYAWNFAGLLLVTNVVVRGMLAAPTRFQMIFTEPPNLAIGYFPFHWLPMFVVPFAYLLHFWSLRQLAGLGRRTVSASSGN